MPNGETQNSLKTANLQTTLKYTKFKGFPISICYLQDFRGILIISGVNLTTHKNIMQR